jgi:hypothetical protein
MCENDYFCKNKILSLDNKPTVRQAFQNAFKIVDNFFYSFFDLGGTINGKKDLKELLFNLIESFVGRKFIIPLIYRINLHRREIDKNFINNMKYRISENQKIGDKEFDENKGFSEELFFNIGCRFVKIFLKNYFFFYYNKKKKVNYQKNHSKHDNIFRIIMKIMIMYSFTAVIQVILLKIVN